MTIFKREYAAYKDVCKQLNKTHSDLSDAAELTLKALASSCQTIEQRARFICFEADIKRASTHIYLEDAHLKQFLESIKKVDLQSFKSFVLSKHESLEKFSSVVSYVNAKLTTSHVFVIHCQKFEIAFSVSAMTDAVFLTVHTYTRSGFVLLTDASLDLAVELKDNEAVSAIYFCINLLLYAITYPERLIDNPNTSLHAKLLKTAPEVLEKPASGGHKAPHFRSGHFRYLASPFFKNKQGTWIFVSASVVGAAKQLR